MLSTTDDLRICELKELSTPQDVMRVMGPGLSAAEIAAYAAPFPDERFQAGARRFPRLVPILPDDTAREVFG